MDDLQSLNNLIAELDIYVSFALVANDSQAEYVKPILHPIGKLRHKIIEISKDVYMLF